MHPEPVHTKNKVKLKCLSQFKQWNFSIFTQRQFFVFFSFLSADIKMIWLDNLQCHDFSNKLKHLKLFFFSWNDKYAQMFSCKSSDDVLIPLMQLSYSPSAFISTLPHLKHKASGNLHMYWCSLTLVYKVIHNTKKKKPNDYILPHQDCYVPEGISSFLLKGFRARSHREQWPDPFQFSNLVNIFPVIADWCLTHSSVGWCVNYNTGEIGASSL